MRKISKPLDPAIVFHQVRKTFNLRHARSFKETMATLVKGQQLSESFDALKNIDFKVYPGESVAVMGHNGSGKSTTLKLLSGVLRPTAGWIRTQGRVAGLIEVGAGFHPDLTGRENVYLNAAILGMSKEETDSRFDEIVEFAEIGRFIDTEVKRYSSGMYARLGFSVAVHTELDVLLVDEVLAVGDSAFREKCNAKMRELQALGKTMFIVSHSSKQVRKLCQRGIVLDHGALVFDGPIDEAIDFMKPKDHTLINHEGLSLRRLKNGGLELVDVAPSPEARCTLPEEINGEPLVSIGKNAFVDTSFSHVTIPEPVSSIKQGAFFNCDQLKQVDLPETIKTLDLGAFRNCASLTTLILPEGLATIRARALVGCTSLTEITIPRTVTDIEPGAFGTKTTFKINCYPGTPSARILSERLTAPRLQVLPVRRKELRQQAGRTHHLHELN